MTTYNSSVTEALAGWGAGTWSQGVWGNSTDLTDLDVANLTAAASISESITELDSTATNGAFGMTLTETVSVNDTVALAASTYNIAETETINPTDYYAPSYIIAGRVSEAVTLADSSSIALYWGGVNNTQTPSWTTSSNAQTLGWGVINDTQNPNWKQTAI